MLLLLSRLFCALPLPWALWCGRLLAVVWYYVIPVRKKTALSNVRRALGNTVSAREQRRIVRRCFTHQCLYAVEALRAPSMTAALSRQWVTRYGMEHLEAALAQGRGVIACLAHIGNIDLIGFSQAVLGLPIHAVVKEIHWGPAQRFIRAVRERTNLKLIAPRRSKEVILAALAQNEIVALVVDQHMPPHRAVVCEFFGQLAATSPAVARFAFATGATILPVLIVRQGFSGRHQLIVEPPFILKTPTNDLASNIYHNTQRLCRHMEGWIRRYPEQWLWLHKRWKAHDAPTGWNIPQELKHLLPRADQSP